MRGIFRTGFVLPRGATDFYLPPRRCCLQFSSWRQTRRPPKRCRATPGKPGNLAAPVTPILPGLRHTAVFFKIEGYTAGDSVFREHAIPEHDDPNTDREKPYVPPIDDDGDRRVHQHASAAGRRRPGRYSANNNVVGVAGQLLLRRRHHRSYRRFRAGDL